MDETITLTTTMKANGLKRHIIIEEIGNATPKGIKGEG